MRQCPDCEEKDRVVIAGKVFCANCGTPWAPVNTAEEQPYLQKVGLSQASAPQGSAPVPMAATAPAMPAPVAPAPASAPAPIPAPPLAPTPNLTPPPAPVATPEFTPAAPTQAPQPAELKEDVGSEIPSLDGRSETVFTDAEFKQLAQASPVTQAAPDPTPPAPVAAPPITPNLPPAPMPAAPPAPVSAPAMPAPPAPAIQPTTPPSVAAPNVPVIMPTPEPTVQRTEPLNPTAPVDGIVRPANPAAELAPARPVAPVPTPTVSAPTMTAEEAFNLALSAEVPATPATSPGPARPIALVVSVIAATLIGAFMWQSNYPSFALKLAGARSGMAATLPSYMPSGWKASSTIQSSESSLGYKLTNGDHALDITQKKTDWDSQAVLEHFVLPRSTDYLALQAQGLTIYVYGDNEAAWVNHGTLYHLTGDHGLSQEDIIRISTSL